MMWVLEAVAIVAVGTSVIGIAAFIASLLIESITDWWR